MSSSSYGLNDALDLITFTASDLEHNYLVGKRDKTRIFINTNRERVVYNHDGKVVHGSLTSKESSSAVRHLILFDAHYLIRHMNERIKRRFTNIIFKIVNLIVPGDIIFRPLFTFFLRFTIY